MEIESTLRRCDPRRERTLTRIDENLWEVIAPVKVPGLRIDHRMTIVRLSSGDLVVHSPVEYSGALRDEILRLGSAKWFGNAHRRSRDRPQG